MCSRILCESFLLPLLALITAMVICILCELSNFLNHSSIMLKTKTILTNHSAIIQKTKSKDDTHKSLYKNECEYRKDNTADNKRWTRWRGHLSGRSLQAAIQFRNRRKRLPLLTDSGFCLWQKRPRPAALRARISKSLEFYCTVFHFLRLFRIFS